MPQLNRTGPTSISSPDALLHPPIYYSQKPAYTHRHTCVYGEVLVNNFVYDRVQFKPRKKPQGLAIATPRYKTLEFQCGDCPHTSKHVGIPLRTNWNDVGDNENKIVAGLHWNGNVYTNKWNCTMQVQIIIVVTNKNRVPQSHLYHNQ